MSEMPNMRQGGLQSPARFGIYPGLEARSRKRLKAQSTSDLACWRQLTSKLPPGIAGIIVYPLSEDGSVIFLLLLALGTAVGTGTRPDFRDFPATESLHARMMLPRITNAQEREFRTELRQAITKGYDVVEGGTEHERSGPNFGGHYVLVQWGCGSSCMLGALIDANTGQILRLPRIPGAEQTGFDIPTVDLQSLRFRTDSLLLGVDNVGDAETYYYVLKSGGWRFLRKLPTPED